MAANCPAGGGIRNAVGEGTGVGESLGVTLQTGEGAAVSGVAASV